MNKTLKLSLVAFAIVAGTLLLMAGVGGTGPRYVGRFFGDGTGLSNSVDLVEGPNILITPGPGNRAYTIESTAAGAAGIFTNGIMGYGDEYRTNYVRISPIGVTVNSGALISDRLVVLDGAASNYVAGDTTFLGSLFIAGVESSGTIFTTDVFQGNGISITNLDGTEIRSGTVADARIASTIARDTEVTTATQNSTNAGNIAFLPADNVFTGTSNHFDGAVEAASFTGSGSGLTNLPGIINILSFGAATNSADNTPAINAAIQAATNQITGLGGIVFFPRGQYALSNTIYLYAGVTLQGEGRESSILNWGDNVISNAISYNPANDAGTYSSVLKCGVKGLQLKNNMIGGITNTGDALYLQGQGSVYIAPEIDDVFIRMGCRNGIFLDRTMGGHIDNCLVMHSAGDGYKFGDNYVTFITARNSIATGNGTNGWNIGRVVYSTFMGCGADANRVRGWYIEDSAFAVSLQNCGAENNQEENYRIHDTFSVTLDACYCKSAWNSVTNGIVIDGGHGIDLHKIKFDGNGRTNGGYAIYFTADLATGVDVSHDYIGVWGDGIINDESRCDIYHDSYTGDYRLDDHLTGTIATFTNYAAVRKNAVAETIKPGFVLTNQTDATGGSDQWSASLRLSGNAYATTVNSNQASIWDIVSAPSSSANVVDGYLSIYYSVTNSTASELFRFSNVGDFTADRYITGLGYGFTSGSFFLSGADGAFRMQNAAWTSFTSLTLGPDAATWPTFTVRTSPGIQLAVNGSIYPTNGVVLHDIGANIPTNSIPTGSATATNWWLGAIGGIPTLVATNRNHADGGWMQKVLFP